MISVIIVNYNGGDKVIDAILSVLKQKSCNFELLIIDNGSTDRSIEEIKKINFPKIRIFQFSKNYGFTKGCNKGLELSKGDYVLLLNNDAYLSNDKVLVDALTVLKQTDNETCGLLPKVVFNWEKGILNSDYCIWHKNIMWYDEHIGSIDPKVLGINEKNKKVFGSLFIAPFFKKKILKKIGGFDESMFTYGEDFDLSYRLSIYGYKFLYIPSITIYHDFRSSSREKVNPLWSYFYFLRNYLIVVFKNYELKHLFSKFFNYTIYYRRAFYQAIKNKDSKMILVLLKVAISLLILSPIIINNRQVIQKNRKLSDEDIWEDSFAINFNPFYYDSKIVLNISNLSRFLA